MKKLTHSTLFFAVLAIAAMFLATPQSAQAFGGCGYGGAGGFGGPYGIGFGGISSPYAAGRIPTPPYFALHPPVYYSAPFARPYGYSPFAYPGDVPMPEIVPMVPVAKMIVNPFVQPVASETATATGPADEPAQPTSDSAMLQPQWIENPYVQSDSADVVRLARVDYAD